MIVRFGNPQPKEGYRTPVSASDHSVGKLRAMAADLGLTDVGDKVPAGEVAQRLSDVVRYRPLGSPAVTTVEVPSDRPFTAALAEITAGWPPPEGDAPASNLVGVWRAHSDAAPDWVSCPDDPDLEGALARHFGCERGEPKNVEEAYYTAFGPPGVGPDGPVSSKRRSGGGGAVAAGNAATTLALTLAFPALVAWLARLSPALKTNAGNDLVSDALGAHAATDTGTSTGVTATTLTDSGKSWTVNAWVGRIVSTGSRYGIVLSNTATALTIDRWYDPATPGGAAGSSPATGVYVIAPGNSPAGWLALTENSTAPAATDTTLAGELTAGGLGRALGTYAHTAGASSYTLTKAFTSSDGTTRTVAKIGVFGGQNGGRMLFTTALSPTAVLANGDTLTLTETVTIT